MRFLTLSFLLGLTTLLNAQENTDIILLDIINKDGKMMLQNPKNITNREGYDNQPSFNKDGSKILYSSIREEKQSDIYLYNIADSSHTQITKSDENEYSPVFMSDEKISVVRVDRDSLQRLYEMNLNGKKAKLIINHQDSIGYYKWINEKELALFVLPEPFELRIVRTDTNLTKIVTSKISPSLNVHPKTGKTLFVNEFEPNQWFICEINDIDERNYEIVPIVNVLDEDHNFTISKNGDFIICNGPKVYKYNPDTDQGWMRIYDGSADGYSQFYRLAISDDMTKIALVTK